MSNDLLTQLADYGTDHEERQRPVSADDVLGVVVPLPVQATRSFSPRAVVVAAVAAAAVLAVVALPLVFTQGDNPPAQSSTVPTTPTTTVAETTPSTEAAPPSTAAPFVDPSTPPTVEWTELSFSLSEGPTYGRSVATNDGFVVHQSAFEEWDGTTWVDLDGDTRDILWTSPDGLTWTASEITSPLPEGPNRTSSFHGKVGDKYLMSFYAAPGDGDVACLYCFSSDLSTWTEPDLGGYSYGLSDPVVVGSTVVAVWGTTVVVTDLDFARTTLVDPISATAVDEIRFGSVVATSDRFYATSGEYTPVEEGGSPDGPIGTVWSSTDGIEWTPELIVKNTGFGALAASDDRVLVSGDGGLWIAESGQAFTRIQDPQVADAEPIIVATEHGFLVSGVFYSNPHPVGMTEEVADLYITADGTAWDAVASPTNLPIRWVGHGTLFLGAPSIFVGEYDEEGLIQSSGWEQDGTWLLGRTIPPG